MNMPQTPRFRKLARELIDALPTTTSAQLEILIEIEQASRARRLQIQEQCALVRRAPRPVAGQAHGREELPAPRQVIPRQGGASQASTAGADSADLAAQSLLVLLQLMATEMFLPARDLPTLMCSRELRRTIPEGVKSLGRIKRTATDACIISASRQFPHLRSIDLRFCGNLTDAAVVALASHCTGLTSIDLHACANLTDAAVVALASHCTGIKILR